MGLPVRLGVNIDHIATVRNARGGWHPDPVMGAQTAIAAGAHGITAHLREDRRHIRDADIFRLKETIDAPLNFEMAASDEMIAIAERVQPNACCLVPEKREEVTTEGGLDVAAGGQRLRDQILRIKGFGARVSLFVDPTLDAVEQSVVAGADIVELHTGELAHAYDADPKSEAVNDELRRLISAAGAAHAAGIEVHAGHGLVYETATLVAAIPQLVELNIGHFLMGEAMTLGLPSAIERMLEAMQIGVEQRG